MQARLRPVPQSSHGCTVMITFLHHSDPTIPHFRKEEWSFRRGAAATVDRPTLGWIGRFFFHNVRVASLPSSDIRLAEGFSLMQVAHDHVAHHFFSHVPFCEFSAGTFPGQTLTAPSPRRPPARGNGSYQESPRGELQL